MSSDFKDQINNWVNYFNNKLQVWLTLNDQNTILWYNLEYVFLLNCQEKVRFRATKEDLYNYHQQ